MSDEYRGMRDVVDELRRTLDKAGVPHEDEGARTCFRTEKGGPVTVFPSVEYEGMLFVTYHAYEYHPTAQEALQACGVGA